MARDPLADPDPTDPEFQVPDLGDADPTWTADDPERTEAPDAPPTLDVPELDPDIEP